MKRDELEFLLTSDDPAAVKWRGSIPTREWARHVLELRQQQQQAAERPVRMTESVSNDDRS